MSGYPQTMQPVIPSNQAIIKGNFHIIATLAMGMLFICLGDEWITRIKMNETDPISHHLINLGLGK